MKFLVLLALVGFAAAQQQSNNNNRFQGQYVFDLLKPALTAGEVETLLASRDATYPTYSEIPQTSFQCRPQPGFYADVEAQCQVFHRCDINGNQTSYMCVNSTVFNQITLICDAWYNVDCAGSQQYESYANSRLYTDLPLFDTPPAGYLTPGQRAAEQAAIIQASGQQQVQSVGAQRAQTKQARTNINNRNTQGSLRVNSVGGASARSSFQSNNQNNQQTQQVDQTEQQQ